MEFFIAIDGVQQGPFVVNDLLARGLKPQTLVWRTGMAQWQRADAVPELQFLFAQAAAATPPPPPPPPPPQWQPSNPMPPYPAPLYIDTSNRIFAGIMGLLLGGLGIHKFILGRTRAGLVMLLTSVLTLGVGYIVMHAIGFVEGVIYLSKSDQQFYEEYVVERRAWF